MARIETISDLLSALETGLRGTGRFQDTVRDLGMRMTGKSEDYRIRHQPPSLLDEEAVSLDRLDQMFPDVYTRPRDYAFDLEDEQMIPIIMRTRNAPDMEVPIYRAVPSYVSDIESGNWITPNLEYARGHALGVMQGREPWSIIEGRAPVSQLLSEGNSIQEFGYAGPPILGAARRMAQRGVGRVPNEELITAASAGDEAALREVARRYGLLQIAQGNMNRFGGIL
jgi:hypothetical protein